MDSSIRFRIRYLHGARGMNFRRSEGYSLSVNRVSPYLIFALTQKEVKVWWENPRAQEPIT